MAKNSRTADKPSYGEAAGRLEEILRTIEEGEVDIDALSGLVKEAAELVTLCRNKIQAAEIQVKAITEQLERETEPEEADSDGEDAAPSEDIRF
jgi:exodeoxyribonuclease VII small subunit